VDTPFASRTLVECWITTSSEALGVTKNPIRIVVDTPFAFFFRR